MNAEGQPRTMNGTKLHALALLAALDVTALAKVSRIKKAKLEQYFFSDGSLDPDELITVLRIVRHTIHRRCRAVEVALLGGPTETDARSLIGSSIDPGAFDAAGHARF